MSTTLVTTTASIALIACCLGACSTRDQHPYTKDAEINSSALDWQGDAAALAASRPGLIIHQQGSHSAASGAPSRMRSNRPTAEPMAAPQSPTASPQSNSEERENADTPTDTEAAITAAQERLLQRIGELEATVDELHARLSGHGRGAYAAGTHTIGGGKLSETLLDRLHRVEEELHLARQVSRKLSNDLQAIRQAKSANEVVIENMKAERFDLERQSRQLVTVRQALKAHRDELRATQEDLSASELQRLEMEKRYLRLIDELLRLEPDAIQDFLSLQERLEGEAEQLIPQAELPPEQTIN